MSEKFGCDKAVRKGRCNKKPYVEVYFDSTTCGKDEMPCRYSCTKHWAYLCFRHSILDLILNRIMRSGRGYCYVSNENTLLKRLLDKKDYEDK